MQARRTSTSCLSATSVSHLSFFFFKNFFFVYCCVELIVAHVADAGKSTISGHLLYLMGMVDERTMEKFEREAKKLNRESWKYAYALDSNPEERERVAFFFYLTLVCSSRHSDVLRFVFNNRARPTKSAWLTSTQHPSTSPFSMPLDTTSSCRT